MLENAINVLKMISDKGYKAYIVGGFVRNYLLGIESNKTINVNGLTDTQINTLNTLVNEFLKANKE